MNIVHLISLTDSYDAIMGTLDLSKHLIRSGHRCIIASVRDLTSLAYDTSGVVLEALVPSGRGRWQFHRHYHAIRKIIKQNTIEIIHAHSPVMSWIALFAARAEGVPFVTTCHDFYTRNFFHESLVLGKRVIVHHEAMGGYLAETFRVPYQSLRFIRQSIDLDTFEFRSPDTRSKTDFIIALTLPLRPSAGYETFLTGMVKATRIIPNMKILIADNLPQSQYQYKKDLVLFIRGLGLSRYVEFFDASRLDLSIAARCNIVVVPCSKEAACTRPLLEAFAYGTPVIANRVAGIAEMIHDTTTGILLPVDDHNAFTEAVVAMLRDFARARTIAFAARRKIQEEHGLDRNAGDFIDVYQQAIRHKRVLIINLGTIGEAVWSMPAVRLLKKQMPDASLTNISRSSLRSLFVRCPFIDEALTYDFCRRTRGILDFMRLAGLLRRGRFDMAIDFTNTLSTQLLSYVSLAGERYGYCNTMIKRFVNRGIQRADAAMLHPVAQRLLIIRPLVGVDAQEPKVEFWSSQEEGAFVDRLFEEHWVGTTKVIGLDISSSKGLFKNGAWLEHFVYLCDMLAHNDMRVVVVGLDVGAAKKNALAKRIQSKPIFATGDISPMQFISLIERCSLYIGSNQELLQLAMALHIPSLVLSATKKTRHLLFAQREASALDVLTKSDIQSAMSTRRRRRYSAATSPRNIVLDKINRLIKTTP